MVKIIGICGSPRRKSSYAALREALDGALETGDVEVELIELRARKLNFCIHCNKCLREDAVRCTVYEDDMTPLYEKVYQADGMIIASPVYEMNITAQLAAFFNRFRPTWNIIKKDPTFFNRKVGAAIAVGGTRNGGQEGALNAILGFYHTQGMVCLLYTSGMSLCGPVFPGHEALRRPSAALLRPGKRTCQRLLASQ